MTYSLNRRLWIFETTLADLLNETVQLGVGVNTPVLSETTSADLLTETEQSSVGLSTPGLAGLADGELRVIGDV